MKRKLVAGNPIKGRLRGVPLDEIAGKTILSVYQRSDDTNVTFTLCFADGTKHSFVIMIVED